MWNTWPTRGRLPPSNLLFRGWGDWPDSDNETNYVKSSAGSKNGCCECVRLCVLCFVLSDGKLAGGEEICDGEKAFKPSGEKAKSCDGQKRRKSKRRVLLFRRGPDNMAASFQRPQIMRGGGYYFKAQSRSETKASCLSGWT